MSVRETMLAFALICVATFSLWDNDDEKIKDEKCMVNYMRKYVCKDIASVVKGNKYMVYSVEYNVSCSIEYHCSDRKSVKKAINEILGE